jgi:hypothetical protein
MYYFAGFYSILLYMDFATDITMVQMHIASLITWYLNMFSITWFIILPDDDDVNPELIGEIEVIQLCLPCVRILGFKYHK